MEKEEESVAFLDRRSRATRGKRMNKLLDDENEEDELFWNQDALKEEENDGEYEEEGEAVDEFDSDFNDDEPEADEGAENEIDERARPKKRLVYPGKHSLKKKKKKNLSKIEKDIEAEKPSELPTPSEPTHTPDDVEEERIVRKSTRTSVVVRQAERDAIRAALQATMKPIKRKKEGEEKKMSQEEMLLEAAQTEVMNLRNLERVLAREEEVKKRAIMHKEVYTGPQLRYFSKSCSYIEFSKGYAFESEISTKAVPYPQKAICVITGLPAKYRDPKTGLPYATKEAFQVLRERYSDENGDGRRRMDMGDLLESISGQGFLKRRKRSVQCRTYTTTTSRFCPTTTTTTILNVDSEDSSE
ncbi:hypothetical protein V2J09_018667 [Rumex salicifolius]